MTRPPEDTRSPEQMQADCRAADLTRPERLEALRNISAHRAVLMRELAQLAALEAGHLDALQEKDVTA